MEDSIIGLFVLVLAQIYAKELNLDIKAYEPRGLSIIIPDDTGIEAVYFWANINEEFTSTNRGKVKLEAVQATGEKWIIQDDNLKLKSGDVINYMLIIKRNSGFKRYKEGHFVVPGFRESHNKFGSTTLHSPGVSTSTLASTTKSYDPTITASTIDDHLQNRIIRSIEPTLEENELHNTTSHKFSTLTKPLSLIRTRRGTSRARTSSDKVPAYLHSDIVPTSSERVNSISIDNPEKSTTTPASITATQKIIKRPTKTPIVIVSTTESTINHSNFAETTDNCLHKIRLKTEDFSMEFYGNVNLNKINPKMLTNLVVDDCDVKYTMAESEEPNSVEFYFS